MRSYDGMDSSEFMDANSNYRVRAYMVQSFFEDDEGGFLPDQPIVGYVPLQNDTGFLDEKRITHEDLVFIRRGIRLSRIRTYRNMLIDGIKKQKQEEGLPK